MSAETVQVYQCENEHCVLGSRLDPGYFSSGMTAEGFFLLTGNPNGVEGEDYGVGICPQCGKPGTESHQEVHAEGTDPYADLHTEVAERVADPDHPLTAEDAQATFEALAADMEDDNA